MKRKAIYLLALTLLLLSCQTDDTNEYVVRDTNGMLPITLRIPPYENYATRAVGDPNEVDYVINLPTTLYLFVVTEKKDGETHLTSSTAELTPSRWQRMTTNNEAFYEYTGTIKVELPTDITIADRKAIRVYAAATPVAFADIDAVESSTAEEKLRNLTFSLQADNSGSYDYIRDIYATMADHTTGGAYYGTVLDPKAGTPSVSLTLYHVAAKVDVIWNVATAMQPTVRLRQIALNGLRREGCCLFRPMKNTPPTANTYQETVTTDAGSQWLGRHSFYIIPCVQAGSIPLEFHLWQQDDESADGYTQHINISTTETTFTPWVRQDILISKTLK